MMFLIEKFKKMLKNFKDDNKRKDYYQRFVSHGHFYSPIPSVEDEKAYLKNKPKDVGSEICLNIDNQIRLCGEMKEFYSPELFADSEEDLFTSKNKRFYYKNKFFSYGDAVALNMFLRRFRPKKVIEVGCGFSSAMILDTKDMFFEKEDMELTFIEPYPERRLLKLTSSDTINLIKSNLQDVSPSSIYDYLEDGDLLFIDSSHVFKYNSDVMYIFDKILPNLKKGVYVHFHDIPYPFLYPDYWVEEGRFWNEVFFLKQFLSYNDSWEIVFWPSMLYCKNILQSYFPVFEKNLGVSIYIRRIK